MAKNAPGIEKVKANRIGFISDTHFMKPDAGDVPKPLLKALKGLDLIVHLGHISQRVALDKLEKIAPVIAVQTPLDDRIMGDALAGEQKSGRTNGTNRVIEAGGVLIGLVHNLAAEVPKVSVVGMDRLKFPNKSMTEILKPRFGRKVDIVAFANTHAAIVAYRDGVLFLNPGSPNLPAEGKKPAIAVLDVSSGTGYVEVVEIPRR